MFVIRFIHWSKKTIISLDVLSDENRLKALVCMTETMISKMLQKMHLEQMAVELICGPMRKFFDHFWSKLSIVKIS